MDDAHRDSAWITVETPLTTSQLFEFIVDVERLFRLNPYLEIQTWESDQDRLTEGGRVRFKSLNEMNGIARELTLTVSELRPGAAYVLTYSEGLKRATEISVTPGNRGATLLIKDWYDAVEENAAERETRLREVDRSLTPWGVAIRRHILGMVRWGRVPLYRTLRENFWLGMTPRSRRISRLILWITALEFVAFLFVLLIFWIEY